MPGKLSFRIRVEIVGSEILPELAARVKDFRPAFEHIIDEWAKDNKDKFASAQGKEASGANIDSDVFWKGLTAGTMKQKRAAGFPNAIMHATGALEEAMTDPEGFFREMTPEQTVFGTPTSPEEENKIYRNRKTRQVVFLSVDDQRMIDKNIQDYLSFGGNYKEILFAKGMESIQRRNQAAQMDMEFNDSINSVDE
jgi:hypothetical protein